VPAAPLLVLAASWLVLVGALKIFAAELLVRGAELLVLAAELLVLAAELLVLAAELLVRGAELLLLAAELLVRGAELLLLAAELLVRGAELLLLAAELRVRGAELLVPGARSLRGASRRGWERGSTIRRGERDSQPSSPSRLPVQPLSRILRRRKDERGTGNGGMRNRERSTWRGTTCGSFGAPKGRRSSPG
jgi:hypothetical protein